MNCVCLSRWESSVALSPELSGTLHKSNYKLPGRTCVILEYSPDTNESNTNLMTSDKNIDMPPLLSRFPSTTPPTTTTMTTPLIEKLCPPGDSVCLSKTFFYHNYFPVIVTVVVAVVVIFGLVFCAWFFMCLCLKYRDRREERRFTLLINSRTNESTPRTSRDDNLNPFAGEMIV